MRRLLITALVWRQVAALVVAPISRVVAPQLRVLGARRSVKSIAMRQSRFDRDAEPPIATCLLATVFAAGLAIATPDPALALRDVMQNQPTVDIENPQSGIKVLAEFKDPALYKTNWKGETVLKKQKETEQEKEKTGYAEVGPLNRDPLH